MAANDFDGVSVDEVRAFWNRRPCNIRHSTREVGTKEYFDEVEARKYFVEPHIPGFAEFARWKGKRVLEVGCGIGTDTINFLRAGAEVTAVDLSEKSLEIARKRAEVFGLSAKVRFLCADVERLPEALPVEPYDLVYSFGVIHHTPNPDRALEQIRKYLHPAGTLKLMVYHRRSWKVFLIVLTKGRGRFWRSAQIVARHSEAQTGSPVSYTYTRAEMRRWLAAHNLAVTDLFVDHIFSYRIPDYVQYRYVKVGWFRWMPDGLFRALERRIGWHLCVTAQPRED